MYNQLKNGTLALGSMYFLACGSPQQRINNSGNVQETVRRTHVETVEVRTRTEDEHEHTTSTTNGNTTTTDRSLTRNSNEARIRTVDTIEGNVASNARNMVLDLEGLLAGIQHGRTSREIDNDTVYLDTNFTYNGNNFRASLVCLPDDMIGGIGDSEPDYFLLAAQRGRASSNIIRGNFSNIESSENFRQDPHTASVQRYVPVSNVVYNIDMEGGHGPNGSFTNDDIMRLVDAARSRFNQ